MKYINGTDKKTHDQLMVWGTRVGFLIVLCLTLFLILAFVVIVDEALKGSTYGLVLLIGVLPSLLAALFGMNEGVWRNGKYFLDETGITLVFPFHSKHYPWSDFQAIFIAPIRRGTRESVAHDYFILMRSECGVLAGNLAVTDCWKYQDKFLVIRKTDERMNEFCKYCSISDPPVIKAYKRIPTKK